MKKFFLMSVFAVWMIIYALCVYGAQSSSTPATQSPPALTAPADWQARWNQTSAEGKKEGKVVLYGDMGPIFKSKVTEAFKRKYGIDVEIVAGKPPEVAQKFLTERAANLSLVDVLMTGQTTTLTILKPRKVLVSSKSSLMLPEVLDSKAWPHGVLPYIDKDQIALGLTAGYMKFVTINKEVVKEGEITSYTDLLHPKWKGKITIYDPSMPGNGGSWLAFMMKAFGREAGEKYLRQLAVQNPVITRDVRMQGETVARGKYAIGIGASPQAVQDLARAGAPIVWVRMKEGGLVLHGALVAAMPDKPAHPAAAALMFNFLLSKEGQQICSEAIGFLPMRRDVPLTHELEESAPKSGDKVYWLDEETVLTEPSYYPMVRDVFGLK